MTEIDAPEAQDRDMSEPNRQQSEPGMVHVSIPLTSVMEGLVLRMMGEAA